MKWLLSMTVIGFVLGGPLSGAARADSGYTNQTPKQSRLELDLVDGTHLIGVPKIASLSFLTSLAKLDIAWKDIRFLAMAADHETATLLLRNGDKLTGIAALGAVNLDTLIGSVKVGLEQVKRIKVAQDTDIGNAVQTVTIETSMGAIRVELWPDKAPATVSNFLAYVDDEFYDGLVFHRVIDKFMIQSGGFGPDMQPKGPLYPPLKNEARADVPNKRGTLAMARTMVMDSATSQFFINQVDNNFLDHRGERDADFGYCVFGKVIEGLDVVDTIASVRTAIVAGIKDVPVEPVTINKIRRVTP